VERDIDLIRQLLSEVEHAGAVTPLDNLRGDVGRDDQRILYHVRLLIDAGLLKDAGQTSAGSPCVRLTHDGSEFVELTRSEFRWRQAKAAVRAATGGIPITVLKSLLQRWACRSTVRNERRRSRGQQLPAHRYVEGTLLEVPETWLDADAMHDDTGWDDDQGRLVRQRGSAKRQSPHPSGWNGDLYDDLAIELTDRPSGRPLPEHLI
jgi:hypothetical protein